MEGEKEIARAPSMDDIDHTKLLDADAMKLAEMGYTQDMKRNFSVWSVVGVGFSLTNSWFGISLSELASAFPNAGGQYFWANELAPKRYANFASYLTGWFAWAGSIFTSASVALAMGSALVGCWQLGHPDL